MSWLIVWSFDWLCGAYIDWCIQIFDKRLNQGFACLPWHKVYELLLASRSHFILQRLQSWLASTCQTWRCHSADLHIACLVHNHELDRKAETMLTVRTGKEHRFFRSSVNCPVVQFTVVSSRWRCHESLVVLARSYSRKELMRKVVLLIKLSLIRCVWWEDQPRCMGQLCSELLLLKIRLRLVSCYHN